MTLQWTVVALFLYVEIALILILCVPFISARRWTLVFSWRLWSWLSAYWNRAFFTMIVVLVVLFLDAVREVQRYSGPQETQDAKVNPNLFDNLHMKLFRAQRNLYISGFSLFLWLVTHRVVNLLNQVAVSTETGAGLRAQMENASRAAKQYQEDNLLLRQALLNEEKSTAAENQHLKRDAEKLAEELKAAEDAMHRSHAEVEAMKRQTKGLTQEYDRLLREHHQLQNLQIAPEDKKTH
ncbi:B-cell receptor-associated protein 29-like [Lampris incognitus]|uniref:B-cell receptor-associated protein 29-like n=1 Tax=Lampris incognitus TaxID=2546036 RepID=UPI0024B50FA8|nr:B-cell receptor-associated protein 29-like [Lampris incognitus]